MLTPKTQTPTFGAIEPERLRQLEHGTEEEKARAIDELTRKTSATAAVSAMQPVPLLDVAALTLLQYRLVRSIAEVRSCPLRDDDARRLIRAVRAPILRTQAELLALNLFGWIPWAPDIVAASLAYAVTFAIGQVSEEYFSQPGMSADELRDRIDEVSKETFKKNLRIKRDELRALFRDPKTRRHVKQLKKQRRKGTIDDEEEARRLDAILSG